MSHFSAELLQNIAQRHERRPQIPRSNLEPTRVSPLFDEDQTLRLTRKLLAAERKELAIFSRQAIIHDEVFFQLSRELDIEETRLNSQRNDSQNEPHLGPLSDESSLATDRAVAGRRTLVVLNTSEQQQCDSLAESTGLK